MTDEEFRAWAVGVLREEVNALYDDPYGTPEPELAQVHAELVAVAEHLGVDFDSMVAAVATEHERERMDELRPRGPVMAAPPIGEDSWLHDDRHEGARRFREVIYPYLASQTTCIAALASTTPEGVYHLWRGIINAGKRQPGVRRELGDA